MLVANEKQWREFWQRLGNKGNPLQPWQQLYSAYNESWRAYHNLGHIGHCLAEFDSVRKLANDDIAVESAIWFHDVVYDTRKKDNEERSADLADKVFAGAGIPVAFRESVRALILATKHNVLPSEDDARLLVDVDLSILGQSPERYAEFEQQIRQEYAWVPVSDFTAGRSAVLQGFLNRQSIFNSYPFRNKYERQARENLAWAISRLKG